jgi:hypothetical protein
VQRPTANALRWDGRAGHYEVYYLTLTDGASGAGVWIRYTMTAPGEAALWFVVDDPGRGVIARKASRPLDELQAGTGELRIGDAVLSDRGAAGGFEDVAWDLRWTPRGRSYRHVQPVAERLGLVGSVLELPHADLAIEGTVTYAGKRLELNGARGGQAHIWGSKHADNWAWVHCNDLRDDRGEPVRDAFVDAVSVRARRRGREIGPFTPVVGRFSGEDFESTSPLRVASNWSTYALTGWRFEAIAGARKLVAEVDAERDRLAGVTYHDPDGDLAYCYNSETASMRVQVWERDRLVEELVAPGRAHFEYAQREPVADLPLHVR